MHLSRPAVQERIARMEAAGVIAGYRVQIGQAGGVRALVFVRIAKRPCDPALQFLAAQTGVVEVVSLSGRIGRGGAGESAHGGRLSGPE